MTRPVVVVPDDAEHGVISAARVLAAGLQRLDGVAGAAPSAVAAGEAAHVQFTDRLWGQGPDAAATAFEGVAARHPLTVTLHDLPQPSDGEESLGHRAAAYARVVAAARGVVVSSHHERLLLSEYTASRVQAAVIPLPVAPPVPGAGAGVGREIGVLGYFYPGKGHDDALAAAIAAGASGVVVLGRASAGHEAELDAFAAEGLSHGVAVEITGYLTDDELLARARLVGVPVVAHRHVSASGSLGTWLVAGRRPVVVRNRYTEEFDALRPGAIVLVDDLAEGVMSALADPASTWLDADYVPRWTLDDVAREHRAWWRTLA